MFSTPKYIA